MHVSVQLLSNGGTAQSSLQQLESVWRFPVLDNLVNCMANTLTRIIATPPRRIPIPYPQKSGVGALRGGPGNYPWWPIAMQYDPTRSQPGGTSTVWWGLGCPSVLPCSKANPPKKAAEEANEAPPTNQWGLRRLQPNGRG